ncbi:T9SS type A sorting domain-containing protein [Ichthyenterobacterium magnum]|uniref:Putative secreted protein (Por secretion system target) n=1 Tax=Ichthyenterobacterium magnum TaxID=1230530 RepID=A0A420DVU0_9FLAO|nr:T9SS type A sorting domain-containing protein [Ichthyenterobacterium magnum]RKE98332.1 putative secreted protein (Por secretion system target) [Ichthyenterobacterium magnum]
MKKKYFLLLFLCPFLTFSQIVEFESTRIADLSNYTGATNFAGLGEYEIFLGNDGVLDKPIIVIDGFDPGDGRTISGLYDLLGYTDSNGSQNLAALVRDEGFDVVILNFPQYLRLSDSSLLNIDNVTDTNGDMIIDEIDYPAGSTLIDGGADFIERNAMLLVDLINMLNGPVEEGGKVGNEELVIIGPSMGGLISRYGLNYMENDTANNGAAPHETRLWLSFDSPHLGANVPLGFQHQFNYLAFGLGDGLNVTALQPVVNGLLKSPAAKQLLVDHFESHLVDGNPVNFDSAKLLPEPHPYRTEFLNTIGGYPQNTRNVSMINGSGIGNPYKSIANTDVTPGFSAFNDTFNVPDAPLPTTAEIKINLTPASTNNPNDGGELISKIKVISTLIIVPITVVDVEVNAKAHTYSDGVDAASGGLFDIGGFTEDLGTEGLIGQFISALTIDKFCFIPSVSGMGLEVNNNEINWFHDINLGAPSNNNDVINNTPFVNWYMPDENENHVELTEANVAFALSEIMPETLSNQSIDSNDIFKLGKNPITDNLVILSNNAYENASINIVDFTGKLVYSIKGLPISNRTIIPVNLESGMYVLNIKTKDNLSYKTKLIVR